MGSQDQSRGDAQILIVGGGFAAVEAALALRALVGRRLTLTLLAPEAVFRYRAAATAEPFDLAPSRCYDLAAIAGDLDADFYESRLEAVASRKHFVRTASGARLGYDALILGTGARPVVGVPGALTFRDQRDIPALKRLLSGLQAGRIRKIVFAVPPRGTWALPVYELAMLWARHAREGGLPTECTLVTPEPEPLALFGGEASGLVRGLLEERGVRFVGEAAAESVHRDGSLWLRSGEVIAADRVVAAPELRGRRFTGVPANPSGFVPVDTAGRVEGLDDVYAAGDMTTFPIKQGGVAAQEADAIAQTIAAGLGVTVKHVRPPRVLHARVLGGDHPVLLRTEFDWRGQPTRAALVRADEERGAKAAKVVGRYLVPYLETRAPLADDRRPVA